LADGVDDGSYAQPAPSPAAAGRGGRGRPGGGPAGRRRRRSGHGARAGPLRRGGPGRGGPPAGRAAAGARAGGRAGARGGGARGGGGAVPVGAEAVPGGGEGGVGRGGLLGEGAEPVFAPGACYPLAGVLLALPALEATGLLEGARQVCGRLKDGFCGLAATLLTLVFLALAGEPRAEGATRVSPAALGRVLGLDRAPEVKTIRRKLGELAAAGKAADLIMALARRHAAARPQALGFLYGDGPARAYHGRRKVQKRHIARLKVPARPPRRPGSPASTATRCSWWPPSRRSRWPESCAGCSRSCGRGGAVAA